MILTIDNYYPNLTKMRRDSERWSSTSGRKVDVYWNNESHNFVITKRGERAILTEFLEGQPINANQIRRRFWELANEGGVEKVERDFSLMEIAVKANKDKADAERREQYEYAGAEHWDYGVAGKHSVSLGVKDQKLR